jgi:hypothetical protein
MLERKGECREKGKFDKKSRLNTITRPKLENTQLQDKYHKKLGLLH